MSNIQSIFEKQKANQYAVGNSTAKVRIQKLKALQKAVEVTFREAIQAAALKDLGKPKAETDLTEIFPIVTEAKDSAKNLNNWLSNHSVETPLALLGSSSYVKYEPKGVCLIISPWNFPFNLTLGPLVSAIAAGNCVILKPSEHTPNCAAVMREIISSVFEPNEVCLIEGDVETSTELLELPFNHIFFTGAPSIGKVVMTAAAKHLCSVTLELGGKSPTIVDETANVKSVAKRIIWGKFANNGQICIAPDYVFVQESKKNELIEALKKELINFYGENANSSPDYSRIVNERHFERIYGYLEDAKSKGANIIVGGEGNKTEKYLAPTLIENVDLDSTLMQNEIFGPVLPILTYKNINEVIDYLQKNEKPLALYIYSNKKKNIEYILNNTRAGGTCINSNDIHFYNIHLPFGGSNNSGIGKSHGKWGFESFSNARAVYNQVIPSALELLNPPYKPWKEWVIRFAVKWLS